MICFPVFEDMAEVAYHSEHNKTNRTVDADGIAGSEDVREDIEDRVRRPLSEDIRESQKANFLRMSLRKDGKTSGAEAASQPLELSFWVSARSFMRFPSLTERVTRKNESEINFNNLKPTFGCHCRPLIAQMD